MTTDNKTLADVQPGGRVRLGDALLPCPFCGAPAERIDFGIGSGENEGGSCIACTVCQHSGPIEFGYKENFVSNWNRRALSAQPSPGGQGDKRAINKIARGLLADQMVGHAKHVFTVVGDDEIGVTCGEAVRAIETALAARQPVAAAVKDSLTVGGGHDLHQHLLDMLGAKSHEDAGRIIGKLHAQAVDTWAVIDRVAKNWDGCSIGAAIRAEAEKVIGQPAQAVGLGPGLDAAASLIQKKADDYADEHGYDDMGALSFGRGRHADVKTDHHCFMLELVDELRALIDSQAVGK